MKTIISELKDIATKLHLASYDSTIGMELFVELATLNNRIRIVTLELEKTNNDLSQQFLFTMQTAAMECGYRYCENGYKLDYARVEFAQLLQPTDSKTPAASPNPPEQKSEPK